MADTVRVQVITELPTKYGVFRDAIYYKDMTEYQEAVVLGTHETEKSTRASNYVKAVETAPKAVEPTKEELQAMKSELLAQAEAQIAELDAKIAEKGK